MQASVRSVDHVPCRETDSRNVKKLRGIVWIAVTVLPGLLVAQPAQQFDFARRIAPFPFEGRNGAPAEFPFLGGFNAPRPQFVDIDGDADFDLFVQEENASFGHAGRLMFFENTGTPQNHTFQWRTDAYLGLNIGNWFKFIDMDDDSDFDLFAETPFGLIRYLRNDGSPNNASFTLAADSLRDSDGNLIFFDVGSLPELGDIDCDGADDLLIGRQAGGTVSYYRNAAPAQSAIPLFDFITDNFQGISIMGEMPASAVAAGAPGTATRSNSTAHGANSLSVADIDSDLDPDIFWGDFFEPSVVFLKNDGSCSQPQIAISNRQFPAQEPLLSAGFNAPRFADIDADGDLDLFVAILGGAFPARQSLAANFYFYRNNGSAADPLFTLADTQFVSMLDLGTRTAPAFADIDADGDVDLFIGNEDDPNVSGGTASARLYFFRNRGTAASPSFELGSKNFLGADVGFNYVPFFADLDSDQDLDLLIGEWDGRLTYFENSGSRVNPDFSNVSPDYAGIDVGNYNTPALVDIDDDGDLDLFVGEFLGNLNFFRNTGNSTSPVFTLEDENYAGIDVGEHSAPHFIDVDEDSDFDLFVGSDRQGLAFYRNSGTAADPLFILEPDISLDVQDRAIPALVDIDNDGDLDFFSGSDRGGLLFFENRRIVSAIAGDDETRPGAFVLLQNYPNPFNPETTITFQLQRPAYNDGRRATLAIYDLLGKEVRSWQFRLDANTGSIRWDGRDESGRPMPSGIYFYTLSQDRQSTITRKMMLLR